MVDPIKPDIPQVSPSQEPAGADKPSIGENDDIGRQDTFTLPKGQEALPEEKLQQSEKLSPFDLANQGQGGGQSAQPKELLEKKLGTISDHLDKVKTDLQDPSKAPSISKDHVEAMNRLIDKLNPDMQTIAKNTGGEFKPPEKVEGENPLSGILKWVSGGQNAMQGALNHLSTMEKPDMGTYMKLQYSIQRASQRTEMFANIVGSTVSGIKTLMSTQLG